MAEGCERFDCKGYRQINVETQEKIMKEEELQQLRHCGDSTTLVILEIKITCEHVYSVCCQEAGIIKLVK